MVVRTGPARQRAATRLLVSVASAALVISGAVALGAASAQEQGEPESLPRAQCGKGARPETGRQGRVPQADYDSGRVLRGYRCNASQVAHHGTSGGFKVHRYTDSQGTTCAFYDSTLVFPRDLLTNAASGLGVIVLDMSDPANPVQTAALTSPAMLNPHESLVLDKKGGILAGVLGTAATAPGILEVYDVRTDCRHPQLLSTTLNGLLGHESGLSPDGKTLWSTSALASLVAIDLSNPSLPKPVFTKLGVSFHGLRFSDDGNTMYAADIGTPDAAAVRLSGAGLTVLDVSEVNERLLLANVPVLSHLTWPGVSVPQVAEPFTRDGHSYLLEMDEFADLFGASGLLDQRHAPVGAGRIINVDDPRNPFVVSDIRLEVHQPEAHAGDQFDDPGASFLAQGYAGHYCSLPTRVDPKVVGCSMIASGLRLIDIRDVEHPREVAYFNKPVLPGSKVSFPEVSGAYAMSAPAWDRKARSVWYTDANSGFYNVRLTHRAARLLRR